MADIKQKYGSANQAITITLASLANAALRQSAAIDNTSNLFLNALVQVIIATASSGVSSTGYVNVYAYGSTDAGSNYTGGASGSDAAYSAEKSNLRYLGTITANANSGTYKVTLDVATAFGGVLPAYWGIVVENLTGTGLASSGQSAIYQGVLAQTV